MQNQCVDQLHGNCPAPLFSLHKTYNPSTSQIQGARWLSGRVRTLEREEREDGGFEPTSASCILEQDNFLPESTGNTQKVVALSRHDWKIVDLDVKPQHKQT